MARAALVQACLLQGSNQFKDLCLILVQFTDQAMIDLILCQHFGASLAANPANA
jgi:hypothetical protein